ncbi:PR domain zinc finger protein 10 [Chionoecetes opilio]|uniref:PR domain zinc finger protein 10 n=1 Tax=Chionoecetes opilio TaxID=41210 RepID=A0A8J4XMP3_CHIOP|nr:PR domain zinc finger protein 10 [Chionoecetes opilio]
MSAQRGCGAIAAEHRPGTLVLLDMYIWQEVKDRQGNVAIKLNSTFKENLKVAMLGGHSDRRDYLCQHCGKRFKHKDKMREHSKRRPSWDHDATAAKSASKVCPKGMRRVDPTDYMQFEYKCHTCLLGFKRRGMLVNHLVKRHPNVDMTSVPELNQPILKTTRCYYSQYCEKEQKRFSPSEFGKAQKVEICRFLVSDTRAAPLDMMHRSSKRKLHILKYRPGEELPPCPPRHTRRAGVGKPPPSPRLLGRHHLPQPLQVVPPPVCLQGTTPASPTRPRQRGQSLREGLQEGLGTGR